MLPIVASTDVKPGAVYVPMHWGSATLAGASSAGVNALTQSACCPDSRQPELKHAAVRVAAAALDWQLVAFAILDDQVAVRDAKDRAGPVLVFSAAEWEAFVVGVRGGEFDPR